MIRLENTVLINTLAHDPHNFSSPILNYKLGFILLNSHEYSLLGFASFDKFFFSFCKLAFILKEHSILEMNVW